MRYFAVSRLLAWTALSALLPLAASSVDSPGPVHRNPPAAIGSAPLAEPPKEYGVLEETPNHRRLRKGKPIVASYPTPEYGELIETPNHMRKRLGLPVAGDKDLGSAEETPNHRRQRLASSPLADIR